MKPIPKIVVLISGNGSNLQAILDACDSGELPAQVTAVISNKPDAYGLERARKASVPTAVKIQSSTQSRQEYDHELATLVASYNPDWIVLAGWMRVLSHEFLKNFSAKVLNLHPALPGMFPGTNAIERAFAAFQHGEIQETGVMVHLVPDEGVDDGPVLEQISVPITTEDTLATLTQKIQRVEHQVLISVLKKSCYDDTDDAIAAIINEEDTQTKQGKNS